MAKATGSIVSLFDIASALELPLYYVQCIINGFTVCTMYQYPPFLSLCQHRSVDLMVAHDGFLLYYMKLSL